MKGFGLIGCGVWGDVHALTYSSSLNARLVGVCDSNKERAKNFTRQYGASNTYNDIKDLLANPEIDAVSVVTPDFSHTEIVLAALEAGKHVLVEKPLALTVEECKEIIKIRDNMGLKLMVNFANRWKTPFIHVRKMVESGELGKLMMINVKLNDTLYVPTKMLSWADKSSPLHFLGSHVIDLVRWITSAEINRVYSVSRSEVLRNMGVDTPDFYQSTLELSNGGTAFIENCWIIDENAPNIFEFNAEFVGSKGSAYVDVSHHRMIEKYTRSGAGLPDVSGIYSLDGNPMGQASIEHFIDCVENDKTPLVAGEDGLAVTTVVEALDTSARTAQPVVL
jgi:predicted dehydrogenase